MKRSIMKTSTACLTTAVTALNLVGIVPALADAARAPALTLATSTTTIGAANARDPSDQQRLSLGEKVALLRQKVKYVFVLFQENRSFDHYFGTYPGANGLTSTYTGANLADPYAKPA